MSTGRRFPADALLLDDRFLARKQFPIERDLLLESRPDKSSSDIVTPKARFICFYLSEENVWNEKAPVSIGVTREFHGILRKHAIADAV